MLLASLLFSLPAAAKSWEINGIRRSDGTFGFCRAELPDPKTGLTLAIALSPANEVNLGIKVPQDVSGGGFKKGETFALALSVSGSGAAGTLWTKQVTAEAGLPELLLMKLGNDQAFLAALGKGKTFTAKGDADSTVFELAGAAEAVKALQQCVADGSKMAAAPVLPAGLAALLQEAKVTVKPLALAGGRGAQAVDIAWVTTEAGVQLDGGFREARAGSGEDFKTLSEGTVGQLKGQCKAGGKPGLKVEGGKAEAEKSVTLATYDLTCGPEMASLLAYKTETGIYGVLIHRAALKDKAPAIAVRDRLAAIIRRLGNEAADAGAVKPAEKPATTAKPAQIKKSQ